MKNKFEKIAEEYSHRFGYGPYYSKIISYMRRYCKGNVLEIGAAQGILAELLKETREAGEEPFEYHSVEPSQKLVDIAKETAKNIQSFQYCPHIGTLEDGLKTSGLENRTIDVLITSRSLHEAFIGYGRDENRVFFYLSDILRNKKPSIVIHGILERYNGLDKKETIEFKRKQENILGSGQGHDPARDYLEFQKLVEFMEKNGYNLIEQDHISQPLLENHPKAWTFGIGVFENENRDYCLK